MLETINKLAILIRWDKPVGNLLLLWPTLTAVWIAGHGRPSLKIVFIFIVGVFVMRACGCVINDICDRKWDQHVARTKQRPLARGEVSLRQAWVLFLILLGVAFVLVLQLNFLSILIALIAAAMTATYPFMKRFFVLPQLYLGLVWNVGILIAFAAQTNYLPLNAWFLYAITILWTIVYDTQYAMADREDDLKLGLNSSAILFANYDNMIVGSLQILIIGLLVLFAQQQNFGLAFYLGLAPISTSFCYQALLTRHRDPQACFHAFLNNQWSLLFLFVAVALAL